jgi:hypothetical protein
MEKYGVRADIQHLDLRNREAQLMQKVQALVSVGQDSSDAEAELNEVRNKITELDIKTE